MAVYYATKATSVFPRSDCRRTQRYGVTGHRPLSRPTQSGFQKQAEMEIPTLQRHLDTSRRSVARQVIAAFKVENRVIVTGPHEQIMRKRSFIMPIEISRPKS